MLFQGKQKKKTGQRPTLFLKKNRKGISEMVGYILLITIGIAMSIIVFTWLKGYVPSEAVECSEGVSVFIKSYTYDCTPNAEKLTIELKNNGRFSLSGYLIHATTAEGQELATQDLSGFYDKDGDGLTETQEVAAGLPPNERAVLNGEIKFSSDNPTGNSFPPSSEETPLGSVKTHIFDLSTATFQVYSIEIVPTRYEIINGKDRLATCTKAKVKQDIRCPT
jgi:hypothetical protein